MKGWLNIVAAVFIAAGLVVTVASLLTPGQVLLGIDFKLAATLLIGGFILLGLARAVTLLERMSSELRRLRKAENRQPAWLRKSAAAVAPAAQAASPSAIEAIRREVPEDEPVDWGAHFGEEVGEDVREEVGEEIGDQAAVAAEARWPEPAEAQSPATPADGPDTRRIKFPLPAPFEPEPELELAPETEPAPEPELEPEPEPEPESEFEPQPQAMQAEPTEAEAPKNADMPGDAEPAGLTEGLAEVLAEAEAPKDAGMPGDAESAGLAEGLVEAETTEPEPAEDTIEEKAEPAIEDKPDSREPATVAAEPAEAPSSQAEPAEESPALYVVEERMFRGKQARILSDGTIEAETDEGWMRFEDFDHLEEYLEAMSEMRR